MSDIRFYMDEHVPKAVIRGLRQRGGDVVTVGDAGKMGATDLEHRSDQRNFRACSALVAAARDAHGKWTGLTGFFRINRIEHPVGRHS